MTPRAWEQGLEAEARLHGWWKEQLDEAKTEPDSGLARRSHIC
jgi:hypothetical protein